jgi:hypothetical protein
MGSEAPRRDLCSQGVRRTAVCRLAVLPEQLLLYHPQQLFQAMPTIKSGTRSSSSHRRDMYKIENHDARAANGAPGRPTPFAARALKPSALQPDGRSGRAPRRAPVKCTDSCSRLASARQMLNNRIVFILAALESDRDRQLGSDHTRLYRSVRVHALLDSFHETRLRID